jgi:hypothetical protein
MRLAYFLTCGILGLLLTANAFADESTEPILRQPASTMQTAYNDSYLYFGTDTPAASAELPKKAPAAEATETGSCYETACGSCEGAGCGECCGSGIFACNIGDPWTIPQPCICANRDLKIGGWLEAGMFGNQYDTVSNGPLGLRDKKYFDADQLWIYAERATNTECKDWDIGGRVDYVYGIDGPDTQCFGDRSWDFGWNSSDRYGSAIPQIYGEVAFRNLKVKIGHFYTPMGYEVFAATGNFFYSRNYMFFYAEPFTHTGFLATYKFNDKLSGSAGWSNGWDSGFGNDNEGSVFLGGLTLNITEKATLAWYMCSGYFGTGRAFQGAATNDIFMNSLVFTYKITDRWTYVFQNDYATNYNRADNTDWYGIDQYLIYKINDCWSFGGRIEWFRDNDGVRVIAGNVGDYNEMAAGINYKPHANIMLRPEIRYDWYNGTTAGGNPFDDGNATTQLSGGFDVIMTF